MRILERRLCNNLNVDLNGLKTFVDSTLMDMNLYGEVDYEGGLIILAKLLDISTSVGYYGLVCWG